MRSFCLITGFLGVTLMTIGTIGVLTNLSFDTIRVSTKEPFKEPSELKNKHRWICSYSGASAQTACVEQVEPEENDHDQT